MKQNKGGARSSGKAGQTAAGIARPHVIALPAGTDAMAVTEALGGLPYLTLLDSAMRHDTLGRYSYVAVDPFGSFTVGEGRAHWTARQTLAETVPLETGPLEIGPLETGDDETATGGQALAMLAGLLSRFALDHVPDLPPFQGGLAGFFGYGFGQVIERHPRADVAPPWTPPLPDAVLHAYDVVVAFDHATDHAFVIASGLPETDAARRKARAEARATAIAERIRHAAPAAPCPANAPIAPHLWQSNFGQADYEMAIAAVIALILDGDIFQANIAQRFRTTLPDGFDPWAFYGALRAANPATFGAFLANDGFAIASSSPERFLKLTGDHVQARPIKGTSARHADPVEDARQRAVLEASEKDRAENIMIVDLLRNDLSRVCRPHSVTTPVVCGIESYASVHHLVSVVEGQLLPGKTIVDLMAAAFPGGSITGAPKIRAMEIIAAIEQEGREAYCGSIGYLGFNGHADLNIAIRTVMLANGEAMVHAGGGITALSDPAEEYAESLAKAERIFAAFAAAPGVTP